LYFFVRPLQALRFELQVPGWLKTVIGQALSRTATLSLLRWVSTRMTNLLSPGVVAGTDHVPRMAVGRSGFRPARPARGFAQFLGRFGQILYLPSLNRGSTLST
jgi:hypothetical protein